MPVIFSTATTRSAGTRGHFVIAARERPRPRAISAIMPRCDRMSDGAMRRRNRHP